MLRGAGAREARDATRNMKLKGCTIKCGNELRCAMLCYALLNCAAVAIWALRRNAMAHQRDAIT
eukprot:9495957-Pyramimonas_sp.AAC.2